MKKGSLLILPILLAALSSPVQAEVDEPVLYCGDGIISNTEQCDDGNFINRDGCSSYCEEEDITVAKIVSTNILSGEENVSNLVNEIIITFDDTLTLVGMEGAVTFKEYSEEREIELSLSANKKILTVHFLEPLIGDQDYGLVIDGFEDEVGNISTEYFVTTFKTGEFIDVIAPNPVANPAGGLRNIAQSVTINAYDGELTFSDAYIDDGAKVYYTLDGEVPTLDSEIVTKSLSIKTNTTLKYFAIDDAGNKSSIRTEDYTFSCAEKPNAKTVTDYPTCIVEECNNSFVLKINSCVIRLSEVDADDYTTEAVYAPLFGSETPMIISTKPSLYITPEHNGLIPRPIVFKDLIGGTTIEFEKDTKITRNDGSDFTGYIKAPSNLWSKSFPINFGYSFKSIFHFSPVYGDDLVFSPMVKISIPITERYNEGAKITVFTFDPLTEEYYVHDPALVSVNEEEKLVTILTDTTGVFLIAQPGVSYNAIVFNDTREHWAKNYIELLYRLGHIKGRSKGVFAPDEILTRAEFTKIALNAIGEGVDPLEEIDDSPFKDVEIYAWYAPYIKRAKELGLINGYQNGEFRPNEPINRVEGVKLLMSAFNFDLGVPEKPVENFYDLKKEAWYYPSITFAIKNKLIDGIRLRNGTITSNNFGPGNSLTRAEMAKLAVKAIELTKQEK